MKDFVLLIVVLAAFIYGYFLMEKLDKFLNTQTMSWIGSIDIAVHPSTRLKNRREWYGKMTLIVWRVYLSKNCVIFRSVFCFRLHARMEKKKKRWYNLYAILMSVLKCFSEIYVLFYIMFLYKEMTVWVKADTIRISY